MSSFQGCGRSWGSKGNTGTWQHNVDLRQEQKGDVSCGEL
jgi:hypothetical protein